MMFLRLSTCSIIPVVLRLVLHCSAYSRAGMPPCCIWNISMFDTSLTCETSVVSKTARKLLTTMISADFWSCPHVDDQISLGKINVLQSNPAESTTLSSWCSLGFVVMWLLTPITLPHIPFLFISSDFCRLAYFSAWVAPNHLATC